LEALHGTYDIMIVYMIVKRYVSILIHLRFLDCTTVVCMDTPYVSWEILFI